MRLLSIGRSKIYERYGSPKEWKYTGRLCQHHIKVEEWVKNLNFKFSRQVSTSLIRFTRKPTFSLLVTILLLFFRSWPISNDECRSVGSRHRVRILRRKFDMQCNKKFDSKICSNPEITFGFSISIRIDWILIGNFNFDCLWWNSNFRRKTTGFIILFIFHYEKYQLFNCIILSNKIKKTIVKTMKILGIIMDY